MKVTCPNSPKHTEFRVSAHIAQEWVVGEDGQFLRVFTECSETLHRPDSGDLFECMDCGETAKVEEA